jgi:hypothetical protein
VHVRAADSSLVNDRSFAAAVSHQGRRPGSTQPGQPGRPSLLRLMGGSLEKLFRAIFDGELFRSYRLNRSESPAFRSAGPNRRMGESIMGVARESRGICRRILLVAFAAQAMALGPLDRACRSALCLVCDTSADRCSHAEETAAPTGEVRCHDSEMPSDAPAPQDDDREEDSDDLCLPDRPAAERLLQVHRGRSPRPGWRRLGRIEPLIHAAGFHSPCHVTSLPRCGISGRWLGRLTC